jgi:PhnB protein
MQVEPYITFDGRCEEALEFYKKAVGAQVDMLMRFKDAPDPKMSTPATAEKIMHAGFRIGTSKINASDGHCQGQGKFEGFSLSLTADSEADAKRYFDALSAGGQVRMPLTKTFFAKSFGILADRFGVGWMIIVM